MVKMPVPAPEPRGLAVKPRSGAKSLKLMSSRSPSHTMLAGLIAATSASSAIAVPAPPHGVLGNAVTVREIAVGRPTGERQAQCSQRADARGLGRHGVFHLSPPLVEPK